MFQIKSKERHPREFQYITSRAKIQYLIKNYLLGQTYHLKHDIHQEIITISPQKSKQYIKVTTKRELKDHIIFYKVFKKYMEVSCGVIEVISPHIYILDVKSFKIAKGEREYFRKIVGENIVNINNIRAAKNIINTSLFNIPTSVKIHCEQYKAQIIDIADHVEVAMFDHNDPLFELIRKSSKTLYIKDTQDIASYIPENENDFIDYRSYLNINMQDKMNEYQRNKIISELVVPIIYIDHANEPISLGYFKLISTTKPIEIDIIRKIKILTFEMVDKIRSSNTIQINKKEKVTNISNGGLLLRIDNLDLKQILVHQSGFSFDIIFKLQQPITVYTRIIHTTQMNTGSLFLGVNIYGYAARNNEKKRYQEILRSLN